MAPTAATRERSMKLREVIGQAMSGKMAWWQAAEVFGVTALTMRCWRVRYQHFGVQGLQDRRRVDRSSDAVPEAVLLRWFCLYEGRWRGYNMRQSMPCSGSVKQHPVLLSTNKWKWTNADIEK